MVTAVAGWTWGSGALSCPLRCSSAFLPFPWVWFFLLPCAYKVCPLAGCDQPGGQREDAFSSSLPLLLCRKKLFSRGGSGALFAFWEKAAGEP